MNELKYPVLSKADGSLAIFRQADHYEVHFKDRVEFWDIEFKVKLGESEVHPITFDETDTPQG